MNLIGPLSVSDLTALGHLDQYHYGGIEANDHVIQLLGIDETVHCLDVGSGIGGPGRYIASKTGCRVTGVELQADICRAGQILTDRVPELVGKVQFKIGDIIALSKAKEIADESFDHFLSLLVFLHIPDREALLKACFDATKKGGTFLIEDFAAKPGKSFTEKEKDGLLNVVSAPTVTTPEQYVLDLQKAGFVDIEVVDLSDQWQKWTKARHDLYEESKAETVSMHGEEIFTSRLKFYKVVMDLFEGKLWFQITVLSWFEVRGTPKTYICRIRTYLNGVIGIGLYPQWPEHMDLFLSEEALLSITFYPLGSLGHFNAYVGSFRSVKRVSCMLKLRLTSGPC